MAICTHGQEFAMHREVSVAKSEAMWSATVQTERQQLSTCDYAGIGALCCQDLKIQSHKSIFLTEVFQYVSLGGEEEEMEGKGGGGKRGRGEGKHQ